MPQTHTPVVGGLNVDPQRRRARVCERQLTTVDLATFATCTPQTVYFAYRLVLLSSGAEMAACSSRMRRISLRAVFTAASVSPSMSRKSFRSPG